MRSEATDVPAWYPQPHGGREPDHTCSASSRSAEPGHPTPIPLALKCAVPAIRSVPPQPFAGGQRVARLSVASATNRAV